MANTATYANAARAAAAEREKALKAEQAAAQATAAANGTTAPTQTTTIPNVSDQTKTTGSGLIVAQSEADKAAIEAKAASDKAKLDADTLAATGQQAGIQLPTLTPIKAPTLGQSGIDLSLTNPNAAKIQNPGGLTDTEQKLKSGLITSTLNPLTANQQQARAELAQKTAQAGLAPEVKTAVYNNLLGAQSADVLDQITDINNTAFGWVKTREDKQQEVNTESFYNLLKAATGTEGMQAALQYGADLGVDPTLLKAIAENPKAWETIADANRQALKAKNTEDAKLYFEQNFDDFGDPEEIQSNFAGWLDAQWAGDTAGLLAEAEFKNISDEDKAAYLEAFGEDADTSTPEGKAKVYAFGEYRNKLKGMEQVADAEDILSQMTSLGYDMDEAMVKHVTAMVQGLDEAGQTAFMNNMRTGGGGNISPDTGTGSVYFFDWDGNPYSATNPYAPNEATKLYDDAWTAYHKMSPDTNITRDEFKALMGTIPRGQLADSKPGYATNAAVKTMLAAGNNADLAQFVSSKEGSDWFSKNMDRLSIPGKENADGNNYASGAEIKRAFKNSGFVDGAMIEIGGGKYMVSGADPIKTEFIDSWDDSWNSYVQVVDLTSPNGDVIWVPIGSHDQ